MANGLNKNIENIYVGDVVQAWDVRSSRVVEQSVTDVIRSSARQVIEIQTKSSVIDGVTGRHPFYLESQGEWVDAADLHIGMNCWSSIKDIRTEKIQSLQVIEFSNPASV